MKKTLILGASTNPERYAYWAAQALRQAGHEIVNVGIRKGEVAGVIILTEKIQVPDIDTVTLYVGEQNQAEWYDYILGLKPKRIVFNPGTENAELAHLAQEKGIETENACTLVLLATGQY